MSYDLFLRSSDGRVDADDVRRWFTERPHYTVAGDQAWYENPVSGVYFSFHLGEAPELLSFNLNYFRPDIFAREAEPELSAVIRVFGLEVTDPQSDGMGTRWSPEGFLRGWRTGNRFAHQALLSQIHRPVLTLPLAINVGVWTWNRGREDYLDLLNTLEMIPCFVPTIFLLVPEGEEGPVRTAVVWAEQMPIALPEVDLVLAMNQPGARPNAIPFEVLRPLLDPFEKRPADDQGLPHWIVDFDPDDRPIEIVRVLTTAGRFEPLRRVSAGDVLDRETLDAARTAPLLRAAPIEGEA